MKTLLVATRNAHKLKELRALLHHTGLTIAGLADVSGVREDVEETGTTFAENAILKAVSYGQAAGMPALDRIGVFNLRGLAEKESAQLRDWLGALLNTHSSRKPSSSAAHRETNSNPSTMRE